MAAALVVAVLAVLVPWSRVVSDSGGHPSADRPAAAAMTIAVLPFRNLTGKPEGELMGVGLSETLSVRLGNMKGVQIVPARAVVEAASKAATNERLVQALGATRLLEGGLQRDDERFRITFRVSDAAGAQVVAGALDGTDLFALQDQVADQVAHDLKLVRGASPSPPASGIESGPEQELYLQAVGLLQRYDRRDGVEKATEILRGLAERHPQAALARASYSRACLATFDFTKERVWADRALAEAESARRLGPDVPEVEVVVGETLLATGRAQDAARAFRHALEIRPGYFEALIGLGRAHQAERDDRAAETALRQAIALQPASFAAHNQLGALFAARGRFAEATDEFRRATVLVPDR